MGNPSSASALCKAAKDGDAAKSHNLLACGAPIEATGLNRRTP